MNDTSASANLDSMFGPEPTTAEPPVAAPASTPELAPVNSPVDPYTGLPTQPQPAPVAQPPAPPEPQQQDHRVPLSEMLEQRHRYQAEKAAREASERMNQQLMEMLQRQQTPQQPQPQPPPPIDPVAEPERWAEALREETRREVMAARQEAHAIREETQRAILNERLNASEMSARANARARGNEAIVDQAREAAMASGLTQMFLQQPDPYGSLVHWYQTQQVAQEVGADPAAYRAKIAAEERARVLAELRQGQRPSNIPPSITAATNSASAPNVMTSSRDFFGQMANEPLRKRQ